MLDFTDQIERCRRQALEERRLAQETPECSAMHLAMAAFHDASSRILAEAQRPHRKGADGVLV